MVGLQNKLDVKISHQKDGDSFSHVLRKNQEMSHEVNKGAPMLDELNCTLGESSDDTNLLRASTLPQVNPVRSSQRNHKKKRASINDATELN